MAAVCGRRCLAVGGRRGGSWGISLAADAHLLAENPAGGSPFPSVADVEPTGTAARDRTVLLRCGSGSVCAEGGGSTPGADASRRLSSSESRYCSSGLGRLGFFSAVVELASRPIAEAPVCRASMVSFSPRVSGEWPAASSRVDAMSDCSSHSNASFSLRALRRASSFTFACRCEHDSVSERFLRCTISRVCGGWHLL